MPRCPYCGKLFDTERGLKQHITKAHTEKIDTGFGGKIRFLNPATFDLMGAMGLKEQPKKKSKCKSTGKKKTQKKSQKKTAKKKKKGLFDLF